VSTATLVALTELRNKMGFAEAFLESDEVRRALEIARMRPGALTRTRRAAREEQRRSAAEANVGALVRFNPEAANLLGPRGGLPRAKGDLIKLAEGYGLATAGLTVDQLKLALRPLVSRGAPTPQPKAAGTGGGAASPASAEPGGSTGLTPPASSPTSSWATAPSAAAAAAAPPVENQQTQRQPSDIQQMIAEGVAPAMARVTAGMSTEEARKAMSKAMAEAEVLEMRRRRRTQNYFIGEEAATAAPMERGDWMAVSLM